MEREIPVRIDLDRWLTEYMESGGLDAGDAAGPLFRAAQYKGHGGKRGLTTRPLAAYAIRGLVKRRLKDAGLPTILSPHSFRVLVVSDLLEQGVPLEDVQYLAGHARPTTTQIYDRRGGGGGGGLAQPRRTDLGVGRESRQVVSGLRTLCTCSPSLRVRRGKVRFPGEREARPATRCSNW